MRRLREELQRSLFRAAPPTGKLVNGWETPLAVGAFLILASVL
jgi:hypothetical protein